MVKTLEVKELTDLVGGKMDMLGPIDDGDCIRAVVPPGCWGPMITPYLKSGHEVSKPVALKGAECGDAVAIYISNIEIISKYASSGTGKKIEGRYHTDPTVSAICPYCNIENPKTYMDGIGADAIKCIECNNSIIPQTIANGYTVVFNEEKNLGITVDKNVAENIANDVLSGKEKTLANSKQHLSTILNKCDLEGIITRVHPMVGNIGCIPKKSIPSSRNGGDMLKSVNSSKKTDLVLKSDMTDAHMDINSVGEGTIIISPVKVKGGGIYLGDIHSLQGNGELAGHTIDVAADVTVQVNLIKNLHLEGPIIIPPKEEINYRFRPLNKDEYESVNKLFNKYNMVLSEKSYPVQFVGSGSNLNEAIDNCVNRISNLLNMDKGEVKNRATISGEVEIGRTSGMVYMTLMLPVSQLKKIKILDYVKKIYD